MTTGTEIITKAQYNYQGDAGNSLVTTAMWQEWFQQSQQDLYRLLRDHNRLETLSRGAALIATGSSVTVGDGTADLPAAADKVIAVYAGTKEAHLTEVSPAVIRWIDNNSYLQPWQDVYAVHYEDREIYIRPATLTPVDIEYTSPPAELANFGVAYTTFPGEILNVLAMIITTYAFAAEEDVENVALWAQSVTSALDLGKETPPEQEAV